MSSTVADPRFPIGKPQMENELTPERRRDCIAAIESTPARLREAVAGFTRDQFRQPYREGGWSVLQVVHHLPDSHVNAYIRFKMALTEDDPTIKAYDEAAWAELPDSEHTPPETSLCLLECLHTRWVNVLNGMEQAQFQRRLVHPERGVLTLDAMLSLYAWHGPHHIAHITALRRNKGWD